MRATWMLVWRSGTRAGGLEDKGPEPEFIGISLRAFIVMELHWIRGQAERCVAARVKRGFFRVNGLRGL